MKPLIGILFILWCLPSGWSQNLKAVLEQQSELNAEQFAGMDEWKNLYYVIEGVLYKKSDKKTWFYSNPELGELHSVNIQNPFKLILFYKDFNSVVILDNNLNELSQTLNFTRETRYNNVDFVSGSSQNNIWLFADDQKLHLYDYKMMAEQVQTQAMTFYEPDFKPLSLCSTYKYVWILSEKGVHRFDEYGTFMEGFVEESIDQVFPFRKGFVYFKDRKAFYVEEGVPTPIDLEYSGEINSVTLNGSYLCIFDGELLFQYRIKV